jgi:hypothetical protein
MVVGAPRTLLGCWGGPPRILPFAGGILLANCRFFMLLVVLLLQPALLQSQSGAAATISSSGSSADLDAALADVAQLKARGCYVQDTSPVIKDVDWGILGRLKQFAQYSHSSFIKEKQFALSAANQVTRYVEGLHAAVERANCICDTEYPCHGNETCVNLAPRYINHYWGGGTWNHIAIVSHAPSYHPVPS